MKNFKNYSVLFNWSITEGGNIFKRAIWVILDGVNNLKTVIFPSSDRFLVLHSFNTFSIFAMYPLKFSSFLSWLLYEQWIPGILMGSSCRFTDLMPQNVTFTHFRTPVTAISHFDLFGLRPEKCEKCLKSLADL